MNIFYSHNISSKINVRVSCAIIVVTLRSQPIHLIPTLLLVVNSAPYSRTPHLSFSKRIIKKKKKTQEPREILTNNNTLEGIETKDARRAYSNAITPRARAHI